MSEEQPAIEVENLVRRFGDAEALAGLSFTIKRGEFFCLLGPSGCGKTTLLRMIAGLDMPTSGTIRIGGLDVSEVPAHLRPVNTVFQSYALFPHMSVGDNVAFGLRMKRLAGPEIKERTHRVMEMVQIGSLADRNPAQLSGGQKQRVALARAIVNEPQVLLLDEPLGALDLKLRKELQVELLALQRRLAITFVYVTHDQEEALVMSDRIAVMRDGRIEQLGESESLYERPRTRYVSQFLGTCNLLDATVTQRRDTDIVVSTPAGVLRVALGPSPPEASRRERFTLAIRPEKVSLLPPDAPSRENQVHLQVQEKIYVGAETHYLLRAGETVLRAEAMNVRVGPQGFDLGQEAVVYLPPEGLLVLDD